MHDDLNGHDAEPGADDSPITELDLPHHIISRLLQSNVATLSELVEMWDRPLLRSCVRGRDREALRQFLEARGLLPGEMDEAQNGEEGNIEEADAPTEASESDWAFDEVEGEEDFGEADEVDTGEDDLDSSSRDDDDGSQRYRVDIDEDANIDEQLLNLSESLNESVLTIDALRRAIAEERERFSVGVLQPVHAALEALTQSAETTKERLVKALEDLGEDVEETPRFGRNHLLKESVTYLCLNQEVRGKLKRFGVRTIGDVTTISRRDLIRRGGFTQENLEYLEEKLEQFVGLPIGARADRNEVSQDTLDDALARSQDLLDEIDNLVERLIDASTRRLSEDEGEDFDDENDSDDADDSGDIEEEDEEERDVEIEDLASEDARESEDESTDSQAQFEPPSPFDFDPNRQNRPW